MKDISTSGKDALLFSVLASALPVLKGYRWLIVIRAEA
jgi:hypothetical protein